MAHEAKELKFLATPEKGEVSALLIRPGDASHLLVVGHGASTNMRHATLQTIAERMADAGIATFRYNFPYMEHGKGRDSQEVCTATVRSAVAAAQQGCPRPPAPGRRPLLRRAHDLHGRLGIALSMAFTAWSSSPSPCISPASRTRSVRTTSAAVTVPMLFLSGTRDELADLDLLQPVCKKLGKRATLHPLDTADHGFRTLKRSRKSEEDVFVEMARVVRDWASRLK